MEIGPFSTLEEPERDSPVPCFGMVEALFLSLASANSYAFSQFQNRAASKGGYLQQQSWKEAGMWMTGPHFMPRLPPPCLSPRKRRVEASLELQFADSKKLKEIQ